VVQWAWAMRENNKQLILHLNIRHRTTNTQSAALPKARSTALPIQTPNQAPPAQSLHSTSIYARSIADQVVSQGTSREDPRHASNGTLQEQAARSSLWLCPCPDFEALCVQWAAAERQACSAHPIGSAAAAGCDRVHRVQRSTAPSGATGR
jgi:hypothetical protein